MIRCFYAFCLNQSRGDISFSNLGNSILYILLESSSAYVKLLVAFSSYAFSRD